MRVGGEQGLTNESRGWRGRLHMVGMAELVDEALGPLRLLHDALLVVLAQRPRQLVVVHRRSVLKTKSKM